MISIEEIKNPIRKEIDLFNSKMKSSLKTDNELLNVVNDYVLENKGKQIRPILTFLSAKMCGEVTENTYNTALSLELLHTASLIHDDIVDDTYERRGRQSVNAIWKNKISVLVGDYILSESLRIANKTKNLRILDNITNLGKCLSEGEILQISNIKNINTNEEKYIEVIKKKTAKLFSICTEAGAITSTDDNEKIEILRQFGELYGICFQIKDDIFDYTSSEKEIGKPVGNDIREGKITLPLLYSLNKNKEKSKKFIEILKNKDFSTENIEELTKFAIEEGGIDYAQKKMEEYKNIAVELLSNFEDNEIKKSMLLTLQHTIERKK